MSDDRYLLVAVVERYGPPEWLSAPIARVSATVGRALAEASEGAASALRCRRRSTWLAYGDIEPPA